MVAPNYFAVESASPSPAEAPASASWTPPERTPTADPETKVDGFAEVGGIVRTVVGHVDRAVADIEDINLQTSLLAFNAQIEAARAGAMGRTFNVVASQMVDLSQKTRDCLSRLGNQSRHELAGLGTILDKLSTDVRGTRLSDLALTNIDLIDRNLYERSCDVRWWATDSAVVSALTEGTEAASRHASARLGVILDAYTVYFDIVLCDLSGVVIANGRSAKFRSIGSQHRETEWFRSALKTRSGGEFGFQTVHRAPQLADNQRILVYSCAVREGGKASGRPLGVLGIVFNWDALAQTIVKGTMLTAEEKPHARVCITDGAGTVLADSHDQILGKPLEFPDRDRIYAGAKSHVLQTAGDRRQLVAHASSPGYETYRTGWHSVIVLRMP